MIQPEQCIFCGTGELESVCVKHLLNLKKRFDDSTDKTAILSYVCYFCTPLLPIPGSKPFLVIRKREGSSVAICRSCVEKKLDATSKAEPAKILQFKSQNNPSS